MKPETKLAIRRWTIRKLRLLFDWLEEHLHDAEVKLREEIAGTLVRREEHPSARAGSTPAPRSNIAGALGGRRQSAPRLATPEVGEIHPQASRGSETFAHWEARRSGVTTVSRKSARKRGMPARAFDLRFAR